MMNLFVFVRVIFPLLYIMYIHTVAALLKSTIVNLENIGLKDSRNLGVIVEVFNMYGFLMCARQCEKRNQCTGFNYMRSELLCVLLNSFGDMTNMDGWRFVNISSILEDNTLSTQSRGKINQCSGRNIQLSSGSFVCLEKVFPIDCGNSALMPPNAQSGVYEIRPKNGEHSLKVFCDMGTDGSGWTVIQKRTDGSESFDRNWNTYRKGFGNLTGEHWLGNDALYMLTSTHDYVLRIEMTTTDGEYKHARYFQFSVANCDDKFRLTVSGHSGNTIFPIDCGNSALMPPNAQSGVYEIRPKNGEHSLKVFCDMGTDGSGWTVIQKRTDGSESFDRNWNTYRKGFGNLTGEHWLGNDALYMLTSTHDYVLRIEMTTTDGEYKHARYFQFSVANCDDKFRLTVSGHSGNTTDSLWRSNGKNFSTMDNNNNFIPNDCSKKNGGGWWFGYCDAANLNSRIKLCSACTVVYWDYTLLKVTSETMKIKQKD